MKTFALVAALSFFLLSCSMTPQDGGSSTGGGSTGGGSAQLGGGSGALGGGSGAGVGTTDGGAFDPCPALPPAPTSAVTVNSVAMLTSAIQSASPNTTILVDDGTYDFTGAYVYLDKPGLTLRGKSGDATRVIFDGHYATGNGQSIVNVAANDVTVADLTIQHAYDHPIHVFPAFTAPANVKGTKIYRVRVIDPGQQGIKINTDAAFTYALDDGLIACSTITLTAAGRSQVRDDCYTGGIDAHAARNWTIRDNRIEGFWCPTGLSEHGIHCWKGCRDLTIERNVLIDNARGIGLGLGNGTTGRVFPDQPCPGVTTPGNVAGVVRNNFIVANDPALFASSSGFDTGIGLEVSCGNTQVVHNTVFSAAPPLSSAIEWRFAGTVVTLLNNYTSHRQLARDQAMATSAGNLTSATAASFVAPSSGDLHLAVGASANGAGSAVPAGIADTDFDGQPRTGLRDVGADQR